MIRRKIYIDSSIFLVNDKLLTISKRTIVQYINIFGRLSLFKIESICNEIVIIDFICHREKLIEFFLFLYRYIVGLFICIIHRSKEEGTFLFIRMNNRCKVLIICKISSQEFIYSIEIHLGKIIPKSLIIGKSRSIISKFCRISIIYRSIIVELSNNGEISRGRIPLIFSTMIRSIRI